MMEAPRTLWKTWFHLGPPVVPFYPLLREGSRTNRLQKQQSGTLILTSLLEDLAIYRGLLGSSIFSASPNSAPFFLQPLFRDTPTHKQAISERHFLEEMKAPQAPRTCTRAKTCGAQNPPESLGRPQCEAPEAGRAASHRESDFTCFKGGVGLGGS